MSSASISAIWSSSHVLFTAGMVAAANRSLAFIGSGVMVGLIHSVIQVRPMVRPYPCNA